MRDVPIASKIGRSIHENPGEKPLHQTMFVTLIIWPSSSSGNPPFTPTTLSHARDTRRGEVFRSRSYQRTTLHELQLDSLCGRAVY